MVVGTEVDVVGAAVLVVPGADVEVVGAAVLVVSGAEVDVDVVSKAEVVEEPGAYDVTGKGIVDPDEVVLEIG